VNIRIGLRPYFVLAVATGISQFASAADIPQEKRQSSYELMGRETRAMQDEDITNPGMLWVLDGEALWNRKAGATDRSCAACHGDARATMKGVAARYPAIDAARGRPLNLEQRINVCRTEQQKASTLPFESKDLLALTVYVAHQSRGMAITITNDERTRPFVDAGRELFFRRQGQLNLACSQCHNDHWGAKLAGNPIPQAHPTGYPLYRLEWQGLGSLSRRLRNCFMGIRAEPYAQGSPEFVNLELYLMWRARGMRIETPAVRP
jgi:L-cysteine S-thiosulfotransferase